MALASSRVTPTRRCPHGFVCLRTEFMLQCINRCLIIQRVMSGAIVRFIGSPSISALPTVLMIRVYYFSINHHKWLHVRLVAEANLFFNLSLFSPDDRITIILTKNAHPIKLIRASFKRIKNGEKKFKNKRLAMKQASKVKSCRSRTSSASKQASRRGNKSKRKKKVKRCDIKVKRTHVGCIIKY